MKSKLLLLMLFVGVNIIYGQDLRNLFEYNANVVKNNPAYAGAIEKPTLSLFGQPWYNYDGSSFPGAPVYRGLTYQQYYDKIKGGISINYSYDHLGLDNQQNVNIAYSPTIKLANGIAVKPALGVGYNYSHLEGNFYNLSNNSYNYASVSPHYFDINAGALIFNHNVCLGFSIHNINNPNESYNPSGNGIDNHVPILYSINCNYNFMSDDNGNTWAVSPNIYFSNQISYFKQLSVGSTFKYKWFLAGINTNLNTGYSYTLLPMLGFQNKLFRISYCNYYGFLVPPTNNSYQFTSPPIRNYINDNPQTIITVIHEILLTFNLPFKGNHFTPPVCTQVY